MIFCNYQVRGAVGGEVFCPAEMGAKEAQEVSRIFKLTSKSKTSSIVIKEQRRFVSFTGKGGANAKGGNGGAGGSGGHGVQQIIIKKTSEKEKSVTAEENVLGLGKKSYRQRQKKETQFPKLPITDFLI